MKERSKFSWQTFKTTPVIGIIRNLSSEVIEEVTPLCKKAGLTTLEITMNTNNAAQIIQSLSLQYPDLNIGAGTVIETDDLKRALDAGASFIVTPVLNEEVITYCVRNDIPIFPGALTPTEVYKAWKWGASAVKVFPAMQLGAAYLKELKAPLSKIKLLPTGGVSSDNVENFFEAGAFGVGMGSALFNKNLLLKKDFEELYLHFESLVSRIRSCCNKIEL
jgi:2-dehydro-3-deoxyphosphogluconate aldolase / (4S)-4-hydroxy-2-oxoglutarate aldolase